MPRTPSSPDKKIEAIKSQCPLMKMGIDPAEGIATKQNTHEQVCLHCNLKECVLVILDRLETRIMRKPYAKKLV